jgi:hypothetical protein
MESPLRPKKTSQSFMLCHGESILSNFTHCQILLKPELLKTQSAPSLIWSALRWRQSLFRMLCRYISVLLLSIINGRFQMPSLVWKLPLDFPAASGIANIPRDVHLGKFSFSVAFTPDPISRYHY